jgi:hypothetical protein
MIRLQGDLLLGGLCHLLRGSVTSSRQLGKGQSAFKLVGGEGGCRSE